MFLTPEFLDQSVSLLEILHDFHGHATSTVGGDLLVSCPCCSAQMLVYQNYVNCQNKSCRFRAGQAIDLLAQIEGGYARAIESVFSAYKSRLSGFTYADRDELQRQLESRRSLFEFLLQESGTAQTLKNIELIQAKTLLRKSGVDLGVQTTSIFVLEKAAWLRFCEFATAAFHDCCPPRLPLGDNQPVIMIPLFAAPCTVSGCIAFPARNPSAAKVCNFGEYRFSFTGLLDLHPQCRHIFLASSFHDALSANTNNAEIARESFNVFACFEPRGKIDNLWAPEQVVFRYDTSRHQILNAVAEFAKKVAVDVVDPAVPGLTSWSTFVVEVVVRAIEKAGQVSREVASLISALRLDDAKHLAIIAALHGRAQFEWAAAVDFIRQTQLISHDGKSAYYKSPGVYYVKRSDGGRMDITNFTVDLRRNIGFMGITEICHEGVMHFVGREYPIILHSADFNTPGTFEDAVRRAEFRHPELNPAGKLPTVLNRNHVREILNHLKVVVSDLPRAEGLDGLGWSKRKHELYSPWGKISADEANMNVDVPNPAYEFWHCFALGQKPVPAALSADVPVGVADLISQMVGMLGRSFADYFVKPIAYSFTPEANFVLRNIFLALGQQEAFSFSVRAGSGLEVKGIYGFPLFVTGATKSQLERSNQAFIALGDHGHAFYTVVGEEEMSTIGQMMPVLFQKCVQWLIKTKGRALKFFNSVNHANSLQREGAAIIREAAQLNWPESQPNYATIERLLNQISFVKGEAHFTQHLVDQTIQISLHGITDVNATDLQLELLREARSVIVGNGVITVDAISMLHLLENFYGQIPPMTRAGMGDVVAL